MLYENTIIKPNGEHYAAVHTDDLPRETANWFLRMVQDGRRSPHAVVGTLTPELASFLLKECNEHNRPIRRRKVESYKADIVANRWDLNGHSIIVSREGWLNDGQNRCTAVVETGIAVPTFFVFGVARASRATLDSGAARTTSNVLSMTDSGTEVSHANVAAAAASLLVQFEDKLPVESVTRTMIVDKYWQRYDEINAAIHWVVKEWNSNNNRFPGGPSVLVAAYVVLVREAPAEGHDFIRRIVTGADLKDNDPALRVRNRFIYQKRERNTDRFSMLVRAWNRHRNNQPVIAVKAGKLPKKVAA